MRHFFCLFLSAFLASDSGYHCLAAMDMVYLIFIGMMPLVFPRVYENDRTVETPRPAGLPGVELQFNETLGDVEVPPVEETGMTSFRIGAEHCLTVHCSTSSSVSILLLACLLLPLSLGPSMAFLWYFARLNAHLTFVASTFAGTILLTSGLYVSVDIVGVVACLLLSQSLLTVFLALMSCVTVITAITALSVWLGIRMTIIMLTLQLRAGIRLLDPATTTGRSWRTQELVSALWTTFHGWPRSSRQQSSPERQAAQAGDQELGMVSTLPIQAAPRTETLRV